MISGFEKNLVGSRGVEGLYSEDSGEKELGGKGSSLELRPREREARRIKKNEVNGHKIDSFLTKILVVI